VRGAAFQLPLFPEQDEPGFEPGFEVRESARASRLSIKVYPRGRVEEIQSFVSENSEWIRKSREYFAREHPPEPFRLPDRIELSGIGQTVLVRYEHRRNSRSVRFRTRQQLVVLAGQTGNEKHCVNALKRWLASIAKKEFEPRLRTLSELTGTPFERLQVRAQRTCWGSRSSSGTISLNLCLLFLEPELVRYLMVHELCHGKHMNHSKSFWRFVSRFEPDYKALDRALTESWNRVPAWIGIY
jgi:predicted metal-dependent hydrolase